MRHLVHDPEEEQGDHRQRQVHARLYPHFNSIFDRTDVVFRTNKHLISAAPPPPGIVVKCNRIKIDDSIDWRTTVHTCDGSLAKGLFALCDSTISYHTHRQFWPPFESCLGPLQQKIFTHMVSFILSKRAFRARRGRGHITLVPK